MASDAKETKKQENGSLMVFESLIEKNKIPTPDEIKKKVYPDMPEKWHSTFELQAKALKKYLKGQKSYNYSRDTGIMPFIEKLASRKMGVSIKDRWNPMDIVIVKRTKESEIMKEMIAISKENIDTKARLLKLNAYMKLLLGDKSLLGISLKEVKQGVNAAIVEESNVKKSAGAKFKMKNNSLKCNLDMDDDGIFKTGELAMDILVDGPNEVHVQARSFRYSIPSTVVQTDLTPKGRQSGAKLGKASTEALDAFLKPLGLSRPLSPTQHSMISVSGDFDKKQLQYWDNLHNSLKGASIKNSLVNFGSNGIKLSLLIQRAMVNKKERNVLGRLTSKLVALEWVNIYREIDRKHKFEEWMSCLYYGAKKEFSDTNGPFIKIF